MTFSVREYRRDDWPGVCRVHDAARPYEIRSFMPPEVVLRMEDAVTDDGEFFESDVYVACSEAGEILGFIGIQGEEVTWLYVDPDVSRCGVGTRLVEHVRSMLGPNGYVLCAQENTIGYSFYQKMGFQPIAFFPGSTRGHPCTCVRMTFPGSIHAERPPQATERSLRAHGYDESNWGQPVRDETGVWHWRRDVLAQE
jgi:GNAT superfamily N-acetyltransferase